MPVRLCKDSTCPEPASYRGRCATHARVVNRDTHRNRHIYNSKRWRMLRRSVLFDEPLCPCGAIATDVDHIQPIEQGGAPFDRENCQALCKRCHSAKTRNEQR